MQHKKRYYEGKKSMDRETKFKQTKSKEKKYFCGTGYFANICFQQTHDAFVYKLKTSYFIKLFPNVSYNPEFFERKSLTFK